MSFLPDIDENGKIKDFDQGPRFYTPKTRHFSLKLESEAVRKDTKGTHLKDAPTISGMHECVPDNDSLCATCGRVMLI